MGRTGPGARVVLLLGLAVAAGCKSSGSGAGTPIGSSGGVVQADGLTLSVPAGALSNTVTIQIVVGDRGAPDIAERVRVSRIFQILPETTQFMLPALVSMPYLPASVPAGVSAQTIDIRRTDQTLAIERLGALAVDEPSQTVSGEALSLGTFWATAPEGPRPVSAQVTPQAQTVFQGQTVQYSVQVLDQSGILMSGQAVTWTSQDQEVATIDANGLATAVGPGETLIMASAGAAQGTSLLEVASTAPFAQSFQWENPVPQGNALWAVAGDSTRVLLAGADGTVVATDGAAGWDQLFTAPGLLVKGLAVSPSAVVAVGAVEGQGAVLSTDGTTVGQVSVPDTELASVFLDASVGVAVGDGPNLAMVDGTGKWTASPTPVIEPLLAGGDVGGEPFVVGARGAVYRLAAGTWLAISVAPLAQLQLAAVTRGQEAWAVSADTLRWFDGASWSILSAPQLTFTAVGLADTAVLLAGAGSDGQANVAIDDGSGFAVTSVGPDAIHGLWGRSATDVYAVGEHGAAWHYDGQAWTTLKQGSAANVVGLAAFDGGQVFAAANACVDDACSARQGVVLVRQADGSFTAVTSPFDTPLLAIGGAAADDLWAVGSGLSAYRLHGSTWTQVTTNAAELSSVASCSSGVWAGGVDAVFRAMVDTMVVAFPLTGQVTALACAGQGLVGVGSSLVFRVVAGQAQTLTPEDDGLRSANWRAVWATDDGQALIGGDAGWILHWDGSKFEAYDQPGNLDIGSVTGIWGTDFGNVWAVGSLVDGSPFLLHFNGAVWESLDPGTERALSCVQGVAGGDLWLGGELGTILHGAIAK